MPKVVSLLDDEDQEFGFDNDHEQDDGRNWFDEDDNLDGSTVTAGDEDVPPERMGGVQGCVNALGRYYSEHPGIGSSLNFFLVSDVDDIKMKIIDRNFVTAVNICVVLCALSGAAYWWLLSLGSSNYGYSTQPTPSQNAHPPHVKAEVSILCIHQTSADER